jgi:hypothetical protein
MFPVRVCLTCSGFPQGLLLFAQSPSSLCPFNFGALPLPVCGAELCFMQFTLASGVTGVLITFKSAGHYPIITDSAGHYPTSSLLAPKGPLRLLCMPVAAGHQVDMVKMMRIMMLSWHNLAGTGTDTGY